MWYIACIGCVHGRRGEKGTAALRQDGGGMGWIGGAWRWVALGGGRWMMKATGGAWVVLCDLGSHPCSNNCTARTHAFLGRALSGHNPSLPKRLSLRT